MRTLSIGIALLLTGCGAANRATAPWTPVSSEGPWSSAGARAVLESREYWGSAMAAGVSSDERFRAPDERTIDAQRVVSSFITFLEKEGVLRDWPETGAHIDSRAVVLAPFRFHLVSVFPAVYVLSPRDFGGPEGRSVYGIVGAAPKGSLADDRIMNHFEVGVSVPASDRLFWASAELEVSITPVMVHPDGTFVIQHPSVSLVGVQSADLIAFDRKK